MFTIIKYFSSHPEFRALLKFLSPKTFQVVAPSDLLSFATQIAARSKPQIKDYQQLEVVCNNVSQVLKYPLAVRIPPNACFSSASQERIGESALGTYFGQILQTTHWNLDLSQDGFRALDEGIVWSPKSLFWQAQPSFIKDISKMYAGVYLGKTKEFEEGLESIGLSCAKEIFLKYFAQGDPSQVTFNLKYFQEAFDHIIQACLNSGTKISTDFLALGVMMLTLYQNLETTRTNYNVRDTFLSLLP